MSSVLWVVAAVVGTAVAAFTLGLTAGVAFGLYHTKEDNA